MPKESVKTGQFYIESADGQKFLVIEYTDYEIVQGYGSPPRRIEGLKTLQTEGGMHVNFDGKDSYEIIHLNLLARRLK